MKKSRIIAAFILITVLASSVPYHVFGAQTLKEAVSAGAKTTTEEYKDTSDEPSYADILAGYIDNGYKTAGDAKQVEVNAASGHGNLSALPLSEGVGNQKNPVLDWTGDTLQYAEYSFDILQEGLYSIKAEYYIPENNTLEATRSFEIDGEVPFSEANSLSFLQMFTDKGEPKVNGFGDETSPSQKTVPAWRELEFTDSLGLNSMPYVFYFTKGSHTIKMKYLSQAMYLSKITVYPAETIASYAEVQSTYEKNGYKNATQGFTVEAERNIEYKSSPVIRMQNDSDPTCSPRNDDHIVINVINGLLWKDGNEEITWKIKVPESGLYKISMRVQQSWHDGLPAYRKIAIDGSVPFKELLQYKFEYARGWYTKTLADGNNTPYLFYLGEGEHTITMSVRMSETSGLIQSIKDNMKILSDMLLNIKMITGEEPDLNYEYRLEDKIPNLTADISTLHQSIGEIVKNINDISQKTTAAANAFKSIEEDFRVVMKDSGLITRKISDLEDDLEVMGNWYAEFQIQPLGMDYFVFSAPDEAVKNTRAHFWDYIVITTKNFMRSFYRNYNDIGNSKYTKNQTVLKVWIGRGKEWAQCLKELAEDDFTANSGVALNINTIPASQLSTGNINTLLLAVAAGREPDVALGVTANLPVEFALRHCVTDFSKFPDFSNLKSRFLDGVMIPYQYNGGYYAIPETMNFRCLIYRKDIINRLGIKIPDTWSDIYNHVLPTLYQNNLEFYTVNDYSMFLFQYGGSYYNADGQHSALDSPEAYSAFEEWTGLYTTQGIPITANFYNRIRTGNMPMGIGGYAEYMTILSAAPELVGRIGIAPLPGHVNKDGVVDRSSGGYADTAAVIFSGSKKSSQAYDFINWWTQKEIQIQYGKSLEAVIGTQSRWNSANVEAFFAMAWSNEEKAVISESFKWAKETPVVLGGYYTSRHITNAWDRTVLSKVAPRDSIEQAVQDINRELRLRREEK